MFGDLLPDSKDDRSSSGYKSLQLSEDTGINVTEESSIKDGSEESAREESDEDQNEDTFQGECAIDIFIDPLNPLGKEAHPTLQTTIIKQKQQLEIIKKLRAEKRANEIRKNRQEKEFKRLERKLTNLRLETQTAKTINKRLHDKMDSVSKRKNLYYQRLAEWLAEIDEKYRKELGITLPLEQSCRALRVELDKLHKTRLEMFKSKIDPIIIKDGPSTKSNYKIQIKYLQYEIYPLTQRFKLTTMRAEHEEMKRKRVEHEVWQLRDKIRELNKKITADSKGVHVSKVMLAKISDHKKKCKKMCNTVTITKELSENNSK